MVWLKATQWADKELRQPGVCPGEPGGSVHGEGVVPRVPPRDPGLHHQPQDEAPAQRQAAHHGELSHIRAGNRE